MLLAALLAAALLVALLPAVAGAYSARPSALVAYYPSDRLPTIVDALDAAGFPSRAPVYFGNYSAQPRYGAASIATDPSPPEIAGDRYRYMPILQIAESMLWDRRRVSEREAEKLAASGDGRLTGSMPSTRGVLASSSSRRIHWGRELGRRFRDRFRARVQKGERIMGWQFDEVQTEVAGRSGRAWCEFTRGIVYGLRRGRPSLGDEETRGLVHFSQGAFPVARKRLSSERARFWRELNLASIRLVGQEYPFFRGRAASVAYDLAAGQRALARGGGDRAALSRRYLVGMTPGYIVTRSLGGNVDRRTRDWVNRWRAVLHPRPRAHGGRRFRRVQLHAAQRPLAGHIRRHAGARGRSPAARVRQHEAPGSVRPPPGCRSRIVRSASAAAPERNRRPGRPAPP